MARTTLVILVVFASGFVCLGRSRESPRRPNCSPGSTQADVPTCGEPAVRGRVEFPFQLYAGYLIVVEGRIGPVRKLKFILDTGVIHSVVDRKVAERLHLPLLPTQVLNVDKTVAVKRALFPYVQFGPLQMRDIPMLVADLAYFSEFATHVDALIGMDLLRLNNLTIDNDGKMLLFDPFDHAASEAAIKTDPVCLTAEVLLQNHPVRLIVDTGLEGMLLYEERVLKRIPELKMVGKTELSIGQRFRAKQLIIPSARLGSVEIDNKVWLVEAPPENVLSGIDGFLGTSSLRARWIKFNFAMNTLSWQ